MKVCLSVCLCVCVLRMRGQTTHPIALKFGTFVPLHLGTFSVKKNFWSGSGGGLGGRFSGGGVSFPMFLSL